MVELAPNPDGVIVESAGAEAGAADGAAVGAEIDAALDVDPESVAGGLASPLGWVEGIVDAVSQAKNDWFQIFSDQRLAQSDPCYRAAFLDEVHGHIGRRLPALEGRIALLEQRAAAYEWAADGWGLAAATVLVGSISAKAWGDVPGGPLPVLSSPIPGPLGFPVPGPLPQRDRPTRLLGLIPSPGAVIASEPNNWTSNPLAPAAANRYVKIGAGVYFDRDRQELRGPDVADAYDVANENPPPLYTLLKPAQADALARLTAATDEIRAWKDAHEAEVAAAWDLCGTERQVERDDTRREGDRSALVLLGLAGLAAWWAAR